MSATTNLYPNLWVAQGSGAAVGLPADFVTVPVFWVRMWWEPTDSTAMLIRILAIADDVLYDVFVMSFPVLGWVLLGTSLFILKFTKGAKERRKELKNIQRSRARNARLTKHEKEMVEGLSRIARGSIGVSLPEPIPEGLSEAAEAGVADLESGGSTAGLARKPVAQVQRTLPVVKQNSWSGMERPTTPSRVLSLRTETGQATNAAGGIARQGSSNSREQPLLRATSSYGTASSASGSGMGGSSAGSEASLLHNSAASGAGPSSSKNA